jgi:uncharacterized membrane protein YjjB (DUF3815 family)
MKIRPQLQKNGMTIIDLTILQIEAKYKDVLLPIFLAVVMALLRLFHLGERGIVKFLTNGLFAALLGWVTYFFLVQKFGISYEIASGLCGISGYLTEKVLKWLPKLTDDAGEKIEEKINKQ